MKDGGRISACLAVSGDVTLCFRGNGDSGNSHGLLEPVERIDVMRGL